MINVDYNPYYLDSYHKVDERYLILNVLPIHYGIPFDDLIHQIHIRTKQDISESSLFGDYGFDRYIKDDVPIFICEEEALKGTLSIFEGMFESESEITFTIDYISIEQKTVEKTASDWKKEFIKLSERQSKLIEFKAKDYKTVRLQLSAEYKELFNSRIQFVKYNFMSEEEKSLKIFEESIFKYVIKAAEDANPGYKLMQHLFRK
ncbi:hypothetical protein [Mucilaginibacter sp.]